MLVSMFPSNMIRPSLNRVVASRCVVAASVYSAGTLHRVPWQRQYHEKVLDHYEKPRNVGSMNKNDPAVGTGIVGAPACGDVMKLQIRVDKTTGKIQEACFKTFGCGSAIASSSLATEWVRGLSLEEASKLTNHSIAKELCLPPVKLHCSMLAEDAIRAAIQDYNKKKKSSV